jgi:GNAT superfamily N-acetyltransferase
VTLEVRRLDRATEEDFRAVHTGECGRCQCVAWWVETWDGWGERTAEENRALRAELFARGEHDGYLAREDGRPVGWCQVGPRDRLTKLVRQFDLAPDPATWAITCFLVVPAARRRGVAAALLDAVLADLPARGARRVEAFPRSGADLDTNELWNGPHALFGRAGFEVVRAGDPRDVLALELPR